jgi:hypothetical protein
MNSRTCSIILLLILPTACKANELVVGVHENLVPTQQPNRAKLGLEYLITLVGKQIGLPTRVEVLPCSQLSDLQSTAIKLRDGHVHLVGMNVLEYNWVRKSGIPLEVLVVANPGVSEVHYVEQLVVHADRLHGRAGLSNGRLATFEKPWPSMKIFLHQLRQRWGSEFLDQEIPYRGPGPALDAVLWGDADATIVNEMHLLDYLDYRGAEGKLKRIDDSAPFPLVPVIGNREKVEALRRGLWRDVQVAMTKIHKQRSVSHFQVDWRVGHFSLPDDKYKQDVDQAARHFPLRDFPSAYREIRVGVPR